jgi:Tfp pilus assembly PilM family ATPase
LVLAKFLSLDFDGDQFTVVSATTRSGRVRIQRALAWEEKQNLTLATSKALGQSLRDHLKAERIGPAPVLACVPRDRLILKELSYPPVPAADEPAIVRFQVLRDLTTSPENVVIDYLKSPERSATGEQRALVLVLPRELLAAYRELCAAAGLTLAALVPRPFATAICLGQQMSSESNGAYQPGSAVAVLSLADRWAEFCLVKDRELVLARTVAPPARGEESALVGEIRRNLAVYSGQGSHLPVQALYVAEGGRQANTVADRLRTTLAIPVYRLDPFAGLADENLPRERRGAFAGAVGALHAQAQFSTLPINFLRPKEPKPARDPNKARAIAAVAAIVVLTLGTTAVGWSMLAARDRELTALNVVKLSLDGQLQQLQDDERRINAVEEWTKTRIIWLDELYDLAERFPEGNAARLVRLAADPLTRIGKDNHVARISLQGIVTEDPKEWDSFLAHLSAEGHYGVNSEGLKANQLRLDRFRFPRQFDAKVTVERREPADYRLKLWAEPPLRKRDAELNADPAFGAAGGDPP